MKKEDTLKSNITKYYFSQLLYGIQFTFPVYVLFLLSNSLSFAQIALLQGIQAFIAALFEIPSGILADHFGRKKVLIFAGIFALVGATLTAFSHTFTLFLIANVFFALALTFKSGTDVAWIYDTLKNLKLESQFKKYKEREISFGQFQILFPKLSSLF